jgi:hypothetical protein
MRLLSVGAVAAVATGLAALGIGCAIQESRSAFPRVMRIDAAPVVIAPAELNGLALRGAVELMSNHPAIGGISGLLIDGTTMLALTDHGWLLRSPLADDERGLRPVGGKVAPLRDEAGGRLDGMARDAEALARVDGALAVAFERDHRVVILDGDLPGRTISDGRLDRLPTNEGIEALATLPDGRLLAIAEAPADGAFPMFLLDDTSVAATGALPQSGPHFVTGADLGPDGRLYLLRRDFSLLGGFSIRVERYGLAPDGFPRPETRETLAAFESGSGVDNMEAIALWQDGATTRLAIASDDNFNLLQRTILIDFEVLD